MAAPRPFLTLAPRRRKPWRATTLAGMAVAGAFALGWPLLLMFPIVGGPLVALAVGASGWRLARRAAPLPHANDNGRRASLGRNATFSPSSETQVSDETAATESPLRLVEAGG